MQYIIAVDGSYQPEDATVVGAVVIANASTQLVTKTAAITCDKEMFKSSRNVYGECAAALVAFQLMRRYLDDDPTSSFVLVYDYDGIEKWIKGVWATKKRLTREYVKGFQMCDLPLDKITFYNQKSHKGITDFYSYLNDFADKVCNNTVKAEFVVRSNLGEF